jgi:uncharacterized protein YndB with AHSA1/START domain
MADDKPRAVEVVREYDAPPEQIWKALTDAAELTRWFATTAAIDLRPGGTYEISWDGLWRWQLTITDLEPGRRLRMVERQARPFDAHGAPAEGTPVELVLEYIVEARAGGGTTLRLVHSGFGRGGAWDDEVDGVAEGWKTELQLMGHYVTGHRGGVRHLVWPRATSDASLPEVWKRWVSPSGLITSPVPATLQTGSAFTCALSTGDTFTGTVLYARAGRGFLMRADQFNRAVFRFFLDRAAGKTMISAILNAWDIPEAEARSFEARLTAAMTRLEEPALDALSER